MGLSAPFFKAGWGDLGVVDFKEAEALLRGWPPEHFETKAGSSALPEESRMARVRLLRPKHASVMDCVVHLAGTGDHGFARRMNLGSPLLRQVLLPDPRSSAAMLSIHCQ